MSRDGHGEDPPGGWPPQQQPPHEQPPFGPPPHDWEPQYDEPQYDEPQYGPTSPYAPFGSPGDTQRYPQPPYGEPMYREQYTQPYPDAGYWPPAPYSGGSPQYTAPPGGGGRNNALIWAIIAVAVVAALGVGGFFLFAGNDKGGSAAPATVAPSVVLPTPSTSVPSIAPPSISVPSISLPSISLPSVPAFNICSSATSAEQAARVYVSAAELGQVDLAQACVYENQVSRAVTESIHTGGELYGLAGQSGSTIRFRSIDGSSTLSVTVTRKSDGNYWITAVKKS